MTKRPVGWPVSVLTLTAAVYTGVLWVRSWHELGPASWDIYGFFYPNQVYAWRSLREGGGLLWNPYQDCGQPFFAMSQVGFLYPVNVLFALLAREPALLASALVNLSIAGIGTWLLAASLGLSPVPALCSALAFQLGWVSAWLASWSPIHIASFAWLPVALWRTERLIQRPTARRAVALAVVLTVQGLPGFFQIGFFTAQLVVLRVAWACVTRRADRPLRLAGLVAVGLALPVLLGAVQFLPSLEVARESLRGFHLPAAAVGPPFGWDSLAISLSKLAFPGYAIVLLLALLALVPTGSAAQWDSVAFYWPVAVAYFVLSAGPGSPLYDLYERLPLGSAFRDSARLLWVTNFAGAILAGWGSEVLLRPAGSIALRVGALLGCSVLLHLVARGSLGPTDALLAAAAVAATALAARPRGRAGARLLLPLLIGVACLAFGRLPIPFFGLRGGDLYSANAPLFAAVRERLTAQDRVFIVGNFPDFALMPKSASLFRLPGIFDYETQAPRLYVDFFTYMRTGRRLRSIDDWYWIFAHLLPPTLQRRLFDVTATRYVIVDKRVDDVDQALHGGVRLVDETDTVRVYENLQALPRARYVPRAVVADDDDGLAQLAGSALDPRDVAWVSEAPRSGFLHAEGDALGSAAEIVTDLPEEVVVRVRATQRGFLFLADQYFPGWTVEVNGSPGEILRANHAFRLVEVPAGESTVVFAFRPLSVRLGALVSLATLVAVAFIAARRAPRFDAPSAAAPGTEV